jgi:hypothetical protein
MAKTQSPALLLTDAERTALRKARITVRDLGEMRPEDVVEATKGKMSLEHARENVGTSTGAVGACSSTGSTRSKSRSRSSRRAMPVLPHSSLSHSSQARTRRWESSTMMATWASSSLASTSRGSRHAKRAARPQRRRSESSSGGSSTTTTGLRARRGARPSRAVVAVRRRRAALIRKIRRAKERGIIMSNAPVASHAPPQSSALTCVNAFALAPQIGQLAGGWPSSMWPHTVHR